MPNIVWRDQLGECAEALAPLRMAEGLLAGGAVVLALFGAKRSASIARQHTRAWHGFLVVGVLAAFLLVWSLAAWAVTGVLASESS
jgi:hypothetical protein